MNMLFLIYHDSPIPPIDLCVKLQIIRIISMQWFNDAFWVETCAILTGNAGKTNKQKRKHPPESSNLKFL